MADSPSDPPSDDPLGSFVDQAELLEFLEQALRRLGRGGAQPGAAIGSSAGSDEAVPGWRVDERDDGAYAVVSEETDEVAGSFRDRGRAYLTAAALTAAGPRGRMQREAADAVAEPSTDLGEEWSGDPMERRKELAARTLRGLLANPKAIELFLESVDPEVLREALEIRESELEDPADEAN